MFNFFSYFVIIIIRTRKLKHNKFDELYNDYDTNCIVVCMNDQYNLISYLYRIFQI